MKTKTFNQIDGITFFINADVLQNYEDYATQIVYLVSEDFIVELNLYLGLHKNFVNSVKLYDSRLGLLQFDLKNIQYQSIKNIVHLFTRISTLILSKNQQLGQIEQLQAKLLKNIEQLVDPNFQKTNLSVLTNFLD